MAFSLDQFYRINRRALIWIILALLIWLLSGFFGLIFLTFILAFVASPLAAFGERRLHLTRRISIIIVYGLFLIVLVTFIRFVVPSVGREVLEITKNLPKIQGKVIDLKNQLVASYPSLDPMITGYLRSSLPENKLSAVDNQLTSSALRTEISPAALLAIQGREATQALTTNTLPAANLTTATVQHPGDPVPRALGRNPGGVAIVRQNLEQELLLQAWMGLLADKVRQSAPVALILLWRLTTLLLLALLFSFLIALDITRLREEVTSLSSSRLHDFYEQAAQPVVRFAYVLGRSFEAQAVIACINALLTLLGLIVLGIPSLAALTLIVFACSFIPVLGVFISSTPIVLVALNTPTAGLSKALAALIMIVVIHAIEAYLLNPLIYGKHLKLNPVLVLLILYVGHHAFGLWGMLLGVPVAYYFIHDVFGVPVWGEKRLPPARKAVARALGDLPQEAAPADSGRAADPATRAGAAPPKK